jgi:hypothetical protein
MPQRQPDLSIFKADEIRIVDEVMADLADMNGADVSRLSHQEWGWRLTNLYDESPERTAWRAPEPLTESQIVEGQEVWREFVGTGAAS